MRHFCNWYLDAIVEIDFSSIFCQVCFIYELILFHFCWAFFYFFLHLFLFIFFFFRITTLNVMWFVLEFIIEDIVLKLLGISKINHLEMSPLVNQKVFWF